MLASRDTNTQDCASDDQAFDEAAFRREQIRMLYGQLPFILLADIIAGSFLFFILIVASDSIWSYLWLFILLFTTAIRALFVVRHRRHPVEDKTMGWHWQFLIGGALTSGITWGFSWVLLPNDPTFLQLVLVGMWLAGLQAGAATTMAIIRQVYISFTLPTSLLFILYIVTTVEESKFILAGAYLMYLGFILPIAHRIGRDFNRTIRLQTSNATLQVELQRKADRLDMKEAELMVQIMRGDELQSEKESVNERLRAATDERLLLLDAVSEGIFGLNNRGNITFVNSSALRILQLSENDLLGHSALELSGGAGSESAVNVEAYSNITKCFKEGKPAQDVEGIVAGKGGKEIPIKFSCTPIQKNSQIIGAVVSFIDVSEQKEMEAMLLQAHKMEAIGRLTGGVAHDFNNLLTVIMGNLKFLKRGLSENETATKLIDKVIRAAKGGADLNNRLLSFSREQNLVTERVVIEELLDDMQGFLTRLLGETIDLKLELADEENAVLTDKTQLENAILNLGVNAKDAMPNGGELKISTRRVRLTNSRVQPDGGSDDTDELDYARIDIADTGIGISEEDRQQIFEPFFTTKELGQGTGLGLSTVYGFMRQCGGNVTVDSKKGEGTIFSIFLPITSTISVPTTAKERPLILPEYYEGTILVVEDDESVREVAARALTEVGYKLITACDGREGFKKFNENPEIELVFSDVVMPGGVNGIEMAEKILKRKPGLPILLATGYTDKAVKERILESSDVVFISKPYDIDQIPRLIHSMILGEAS